MTTRPLEPRVSVLEQALLELALAQARTQTQLDQLSAETGSFRADQARTQTQLDQLSAETGSFRADQARTQTQLDQLSAETRAFRADQARTQTQLDQLSADQTRTQTQLDRFSAETHAFEARIAAAVDHVEASVGRIEAWGTRMDARADRIDRQWGELANKMGTLTEDIVLPGIPTVFRTLFGAEGTVELAVRVRRRHRADPGRDEEFDAVASAGDVVLVAESKSSLRPEHVSEFVEKLSRSRGFLPETDGRRVMGLLASFRLEPSLVVAGEKQGLIMVGLGSGLLQVLNAPGFVPRAF